MKRWLHNIVDVKLILQVHEANAPTNEKSKSNEITPVGISGIPSTPQTPAKIPTTAVTTKP